MQVTESLSQESLYGQAFTTPPPPVSCTVLEFREGSCYHIPTCRAAEFHCSARSKLPRQVRGNQEMTPNWLIECSEFTSPTGSLCPIVRVTQQICLNHCCAHVVRRPCQDSTTAFVPGCAVKGKGGRCKRPNQR